MGLRYLERESTPWSLPALSILFYAAAGKIDDALIDYNLLKRAFIEQPYIYNFDMPDIKYLPESKDDAILSIIGLAGLSPVKEALNLRLRTDKDLNLVQILYTDPERQDSEYGHLALPVSEDYYFKFSIDSSPRSESIAF